MELNEAGMAALQASYAETIAGLSTRVAQLQAILAQVTEERDALLAEREANS